MNLKKILSVLFSVLMFTMSFSQIIYANENLQNRELLIERLSIPDDEKAIDNIIRNKASILPDDDDPIGSYSIQERVVDKAASYLITYTLTLDYDLWDNHKAKVYEIDYKIVATGARVNRVSLDMNIKSSGIFGETLFNESFAEDCGSKYTHYGYIGRVTVPYDVTKVTLKTSNVKAYLTDGHGWVSAYGFNKTYTTDPN